MRAFLVLFYAEFRLNIQFNFSRKILTFFHRPHETRKTESHNIVEKMVVSLVIVHIEIGNLLVKDCLLSAGAIRQCIFLDATIKSV